MKRIVLILVTVLLGIGLFAQVPKVNQNVYGIRVKNAINRAIDTVNATYVDVSAVVDTNDAQTVILNDHEFRVDKLELWHPVTNSLNIPVYDAANSLHWLIDSQADWDSINSATKRFFYVAPGKYSYEIINSSGTNSAKRYLSLYNNNDTHPALLNTEDQASVDLYFNNADYWVVDRISNLDSKRDEALYIDRGINYMIFNRLNIVNFANNGIGVRTDTVEAGWLDSIFIQNCKIGPMSYDGIDNDAVGIILRGLYGTVDTVARMTNIFITDNEIYNCNDGISLSAAEGDNSRDFRNVQILRNEIYVDKNVYTDGSGNLVDSDTAWWAFTENGIDVKCGTYESAQRVLIKDNVFHGFRRTDTNGGGSGSNGEAIVMHYEAYNVAIKDNVFYDNARCVTMADPGGLTYSVDTAEVSGNIFYDNGRTTLANPISLNTAVESNEVHFTDNVIVETTDDSDEWFDFYNSEVNLTIDYNVIINCDQSEGTRTESTTVENNYFYATTRQEEGDGTYNENAAAANMQDTTFTIKKLTRLPGEVTLYDVITTSDSPHY